MNIKELEALRELATKGKWGTFDHDNQHVVSTPLDEDGCFGYPAAESADHPDGRYVIAIHNAAPELIAAARRLEALEEAMRERDRECDKIYGGQIGSIAMEALRVRAEQILKERSK
jgi:hypothetical protein